MSFDYKLAEQEQARSMTPEELEREWYEKAFAGRGDSMRQLTLRAVIMGSILGGFMSLTNIYVGLKTGWGLGVAITACILSFTIWKSLRKALPGLFRTDFSILENNCMQSTASAAGYSTGGTIVSAVSAYLIINGQHIPYGILTGWVFFLAVLGVCMAIPMKRQMINIERLKFPSGVAAAETLKSLHGTGAGAVSSAKTLFATGGIGVALITARDILQWFPSQFYIFGSRLAQYTIAWDNSLLMVGAGAIMGFRSAWSILLGGILCWGVLAPIMHHAGVIQELGYRSIVTWTLWGGAACMVTSGLLSFFMQWKVILRAFSGLSSVFSANKPKIIDDFQKKIDAIEVPGSWFALGMVIGGTGIVYMIYHYFGVAVWMGILAVVMSFFLGLVACRACGETDTTPVGAMGKITQLFYGAIAPRQMTTNLMTACITAGVADSSSDLLIDLKSGWMLGANPRKQFIAQFLGIFTGTLVTVPIFYTIVPTVDVLGSDQFPAPAAQVWASVAKLLGAGLESLHPTARWALVIGGLVGIILPLLDRALPKYRKYIPSPMGLGLAFTFHFWYAFSMFIGGLIALILEKKNTEWSDKYVIPAASGLIAGESLMGILVAWLAVKGII